MKYIIEFEDEPSIVEEGLRYYRCKQVPYWGLSPEIIKNLTPYTEPDRKAIEDEVWELAKKLISMSGNEVSDMIGYTTNFGEVMYNVPYQEAKAKYEAWKKQKEEIHVGDEVTSKYGDGVVIDIVGNESVHILGKDGHWNEYAEGEYKKTGRHFDTVKKLLEEMRGKE